MDDPRDAIALISRVHAAPTILDVVCRTTGMGFAAIARVTENRWIACSVRDQIAFGLEAGGELRIESTICQEIGQHKRPVVIEDVATDPVYACHPTPAMYSFQSYISMPIILSNGSFFGTLCAIDPHPHIIEAETVSMFELFAQLIAFHVDALEQVDRANALTETQIRARRSAGSDMASFARAFEAQMADMKLLLSQAHMVGPSASPATQPGLVEAFERELAHLLNWLKRLVAAGA